MSGWFRRSSGAPAPAPGAAPPSHDPDPATQSKVLPRFLAAITQPAPVLVDLGPVVGANIEFLGDRLGCKIFVEDLIGEVEACARRGERDQLDRILSARLTQPEESVDGILCWDLFDFLDRAAGRALAERLTRLLRKGGALYAFFGLTAGELTTYSRFTIEADDRLRMRPVPATPVGRNVLVPRDVIKMFSGLTVAESVLLKTNTRETLLRKL